MHQYEPSEVEVSILEMFANMLNNVSRVVQLANWCAKKVFIIDHSSGDNSKLLAGTLYSLEPLFGVCFKDCTNLNITPGQKQRTKRYFGQFIRYIRIIFQKKNFKTCCNVELWLNVSAKYDGNFYFQALESENNSMIRSYSQYGMSQSPESVCLLRVKEYGW